MNNRQIRETAAQIAERNKVAVHVVYRAIDRLLVEPVERYGTTNLFAPDAIRAIDAELRRVQDEHRDRLARRTARRQRRLAGAEV